MIHLFWRVLSPISLGAAPVTDYIDRSGVHVYYLDTTIRFTKLLNGVFMIRKEGGREGQGVTS